MVNVVHSHNLGYTIDLFGLNIAATKFPSFVKSVIRRWRRGMALDKHWQPQYKVCQPCRVNYDFVGHYETLREDAEIVLRRLDAADAVDQFPVKDPIRKVKGQTSSKVMEEYYGQIPRSDLEELYELYKMDYEMFGFELPIPIKP